jgi:hypothetical protein
VCIENLFSPKVQTDKSVSRQQQADAARARADEEARQGRIREGMGAIDQAFAGFNDDFYKGRADAYQAYYEPQLQDQFEKARSSLLFALTRSGLVNSSVAADKQADLSKSFEDQRSQIISRALASANDQRSRIANQKSALVGQLNSTGDSTQASQAALATSKQLAGEQPEYSPLGDIFAGVAAGIGNAAAAKGREDTYNAYFGRANTGRIVGG